MFLFSILSFLFLFINASQTNVYIPTNNFEVTKGTVDNCDAMSLFQYEEGSLLPPLPLSPPETNTSLQLTFSNNWKVVDDGYINYVVNLNGVPYSYSESLCQGVNLTCPIELGRHNVFSDPIDISTVSGKLVITAEYTDKNSQKLLCVKTVFQ